MEEGDLRSTLSDFMDKVSDNVSEFEELEEERDELAEKVEEATGYFAEKASEHVRLEEDLIADRFSFSEVVEMAEDAEAATEVVEENDEDSEAESESTFDDKPERAPQPEGDSNSTFAKEANTTLESLGLVE
ncbi:hypothetical protein ACFQL7_20895 [Halocatena marina]|uniref:Uncharacterized protein n=1 Tax=Halocatena marina TaxID=2934937 RepID=A0ABD5YUE5_9EURY|nr:hypothetical protein [Halocatena marina]